MGEEQAVPDLINALSDPIHDVRASSAEALGIIGDSSAVLALLKCFRTHNEHGQVVKAAEKQSQAERLEILNQLNEGELSVDEAMAKIN